MAAITLRIRQILPQFFADEDIANVPERARLIYIGLWCVADDSGFFPWKPGEIAYHLGLQRLGRAGIIKAVDDIRALPGRCRVELLDCGRHAVVVNLPQYQRYAKSTHAVHRHKDEHTLECSPAIAPPEPHDFPTSSPLGTVRNGTERSVGEMRDKSSSTTEQAIAKAKAKAAAA